MVYLQPHHPIAPLIMPQHIKCLNLLFITFSFLCYIVFSNCYAEEPLIITGDFILHHNGTDNSDLSSGTFYYRTPNYFALIVDTPIKQYILFNNNKTLIYYPTENKGFEMGTIHTYDLLKYFSTNRCYEDNLRANSLYVLSSNNFNNGRYINTWKANKRKVSPQYIILAKDSNNILYSIEAKDKNGKYIFKINFDGYVNISTIKFPSGVTSVDYSTGNALRENMMYRNIKQTPGIPKYLLQIPPQNALIKHYD